jgi:hypothetical protein
VGEKVKAREDKRELVLETLRYIVACRSTDWDQVALLITALGVDQSEIGML